MISWLETAGIQINRGNFHSIFQPCQYIRVSCLSSFHWKISASPPFEHYILSYLLPFFSPDFSKSTARDSLQILLLILNKSEINELSFSVKSLENYTCDVSRDLVPFEQFKRREKLTWRSFIFNKVATLLKVTILDGCFSRF